MELEWRFFLKNGLPEFVHDHPDIDDAVGLMEVLTQEKKYAPYPILRDLCCIGLTLNFSNCVVEDSYSTMKLVKNYLTNALKDRTVDDILQIKLNGPPEMPVCVSLLSFSC